MNLHHVNRYRHVISPAGQPMLSATPIGVTTGNEPGRPAAGLNIFGYDDQGRPLDALGNVLPGTLPQAIGVGTPGVAPTTSSTSSYVVPVAIGVGVLALVMLLK
jgi:hypothetical protein